MIMKEERLGPVQSRCRGGDAMQIFQQQAEDSTTPRHPQPFKQLGAVAEGVVRDTLLAELRQAHRHIQLVLNEIDFAGVALGSGLVTTKGAMELLSDIALEFLDLEPRAIETRRAAA